MRVVALEEHFQHPDVGALYGPLDANRAPQILQRLEDLGDLRIKEMDAAGIDLQVISHSAPAMQKMDSDGKPQPVSAWTSLLRRNSVEYDFTAFIDQFYHPVVSMLSGVPEP